MPCFGTRVAHLWRAFRARVGFVLIAACMSVEALAQVGAPPGGHQITNTAEVTYVDPASVTITLPSNTVSATVPFPPPAPPFPVEAFTLTTDRSYHVSAGTTAVMPHVLTNGSEFPVNFRLDFRNLTGDAYDLSSLALVQDVNANGIIDPGEPVLTTGTELLLGSGHIVHFLLTGVVPTVLADGSLARVEITATSVDTGNSLTNVDTISVRTPQIILTKSGTPTVANRGSTVAFTVSGTNNGGFASPITALVNGVPTSLVIMRDEVPANTTLVDWTQTSTGVRLYHRSGDPWHTYTTTLPSDPSTIDAVALGLTTFGPGASFNASFEVKVNANASAPFTNVAKINYLNGTVESTVLSNVVTITIPTVPPRLVFYRDTTFTGTTNTGHLGNSLHIEGDAAACNFAPLVIETVTIVIESTLTGDREPFLAVETGPNTGIFRVAAAPTADASRVLVVSGDGTIQSLPDDPLIASIEGCGGTLTIANIVIDPAGVVRDSQTCDPIAGATVTLIDVTGLGNGGNPGGLAVVFLPDTVTRAPNPVVTGADGRYEFPLVAPSLYRIDVQGPPGSSFPSQLPTSPCVTIGDIRLGSNGEPFPVDTSTGAVFVDVVVDIPTSTSGFALEKAVSRDLAELGDSLVYTLTLSNSSPLPFLGIAVDDQLPPGFTYEPGSARVDGALIPNPTGGRGPSLVFTAGDLPSGKKKTLTYRVRVESDARLGENINIAQARTTAGVSIVTNRATARVVIEDGIFTDKGVIIGKVFLDANRNRLQDAAEPGVPGVRLYLEDGTFAVTDSEGKYSFYGVRPVAHTLKLDRTTLPAGAELIAIDSRNAGDPGSRFVDLQRGELHKANFAIDPANPATVEAVDARREKGEVEVAALESLLRDRLEADSRAQPLSDIRNLPASGVISGNGATATTESTATSSTSLFTSVLPAGTLTAGNSAVPAAPVATVALAPLENFLDGLTDPSPGFLGLNDGDTVAARQTTVRIKGPMGSAFTLTVNDVPVPAKRVGKKVTSVITQIEAWEFIGLDLQPGPNRLELIVQDSFGNERARRAITIRAPDALARVQADFSNPEPFADGLTPVTVTVRLVDATGTPVSARTPLTLEAKLGRWQVDDLDENEPGFQVFIEGGLARYTLLPPDAPGDDRIVISSGAIKNEFTLPYLPDLRPLIASGVLEGRVQLKGLGVTGLQASTPSDAFEDELQEFSRTDDLRTSGRAAFFLKGKIKGDFLLTAAYDSDKNTRERLFRDIEPDRYYPVYGDSSLRGYDAQSTRRLYVRVDKKKSYLLLGDFNTLASGDQRALGNYQRSLNGARAHFENKRAVANVWGSRDTTKQVIQEIPADGTSGPYQFRAAFGLINSERVELLTRDRNQPSLIIATEPMTRFRDYDFEPFTGRILFREPLRSADENLNPRSIRITYEVDQGGNPFWVYGVDGQIRLHDRLEVGGSAVRDENPTDQQTILSANATVKLAEGTYLLGEVAQSDTDLQGTGLAGRLDLRHKSDKTEARLYYGQTETSFVNPGALLPPGRIESGAKVTHEIDARNRVIAQGLITESIATGGAGGRREGVRADWEHNFANKVTVEVGARWSQETGDAAGATTRPGAITPPPGAATATPVTPFEVRSLRVKVSTPLPNIANASIFGEVEQDVAVSGQRLVAAGGEWQFSTRGRLYARHEFISALGGPFELNQTQQNNITLIGFESDYMKGGRLFNEYRARDAFNGRETEASTGLRNTFTLADGLRLNASVERVTPFDGTTQNESTAVTTAIEYTANPLWKATARIEARWADTSDSLLNTLGYARKLDRDWTFLAKTIYYAVNQKDATARDVIQARILTGLAWRPTDNDRWNALGKYEYRYEDGSTIEKPADVLRHVHLFSVSANWQPSRDWILSSRYAFKAVDENYAGDNARYFGQIISARIMRQLSIRWDAGLNVSAGASRGLDRYDWAIGPEVGYNFKANFRLGLGYNITGFYDRDLVGDMPTQRGLYLNLRMKFDEDLIGLRHLLGAEAPVAIKEENDE